MYIAHITGVRLPAAPMPSQICQAQAEAPAARTRATTQSQAKYFSPGMPMVRMTSRLTSAQVAWAGAVVLCAGGALTLVPGLPVPARRLGADDLLEIAHARERAQLVEHVVAPGRVRQLGDERVAVLPVPEGDRPGRARLLTRGLHVAVAHLASRLARRAFGGLDPLHAHGALLHHTQLAHRDVRIELQVERRGPRVVEPVELPDVVGAVVAAVARAHAPVVDLPVEAFARVVGGIDRAHRLARRDLAVLAEHGQEHVDRLGGGTLLP